MSSPEDNRVVIDSELADGCEATCPALRELLLRRAALRARARRFSLSFERGFSQEALDGKIADRKNAILVSGQLQGLSPLDFAEAMEAIETSVTHEYEHWLEIGLPQAIGAVTGTLSMVEAEITERKTGCSGAIDTEIPLATGRIALTVCGSSRPRIGSEQVEISVESE